MRKIVFGRQLPSTIDTGKENLKMVIQQLTISLRGGQTVVVPFNAEKADQLNTQIEAFLADVSAAEVISLVRKEEVAE